MDNLSHSLVGLAFAELVQRSLPSEPDHEAQSLRRRVLLILSCIASNFPDVDLLLNGLLPAPLGYLLHHRGLTHALLFSLVQAPLLMALTWMLWPAARRLLRASGAARQGLAAVTFACLLMHIMMDFLNSYGVHPFYPFDVDWQFGDLLFIIEPVLWVAFAAPLLLMVPVRWLKFALAGLLCGVLALSTALAFLHWSALPVLALVGAMLAWLQRGAGRQGRRALVAAFLTAGAFIGIQAAASHQGKQVIASQLQRMDPASRLLDISMTAFPANPLCWMFVSVERNDGAGTYRLRRGQLALAPGVMPMDACPASLSEPGVVRSASISLASQSDASLASLRRLASNCNFHAWLRFARAPVVGLDGATDMRFPTSEGKNFSTIAFDGLASQPCPTSLPVWSLPRQDLLSP